MWRKALAAVSLVGLILTATFADTYGEKVKSVDVEKKTITIPVEKKDKTFPVADTCKVQAQMKTGKIVKLVPEKEGLKAIKVGGEVILSTERVDGVEVITGIVIVATTPTPKKKDNK